MKNHTNEDVHTYILKSYQGIHARRWLRFETTELRKAHFANLSHPSIIEFYSSYTLGDSYNIVLEYADMGTLEQLFDNITEPRRGVDINNFWRSLLNISDGLRYVQKELTKHIEPSRLTIIERFLSFDIALYDHTSADL